MKVSDMLQHLLYQLGKWLQIRKMSLMHKEYAYLKKRVEVLESLLKEKTQSVDRAKSIFLKNLYHEIRTPLNSIVGFSDLIERNNLTTEDKTVYISHIRESSKEFLQKMDNIIDASILEAGLLKLSSNECSIHNLVTEIYAYFSIQKRISEKRIAFLLNVPEDSKNLKILCDSCRITQVLTNLLSNAFKFTNKGTVEMGYSIKGNEIEFFVTDTGIGIVDGKENRVFNNFTKLDESDNANEGLGLGLGLSKKLVELMHGRIWYKSNLSQGTSFYFTLPFVPVASQKQSTKKADGKTLAPNFSYSLRRSVVL
jgi:signal transduction histidine kinase